MPEPIETSPRIAAALVACLAQWCAVLPGCSATPECEPLEAHRTPAEAISARLTKTGSVPLLATLAHSNPIVHERTADFSDRCVLWALWEDGFCVRRTLSDRCLAEPTVGWLTSESLQRVRGALEEAAVEFDWQPFWITVNSHSSVGQKILSVFWPDGRYWTYQWDRNAFRTTARAPIQVWPSEYEVPFIQTIDGLFEFESPGEVTAPLPEIADALEQSRGWRDRQALITYYPEHIVREIDSRRERDR